MKTDLIELYGQSVAINRNFTTGLYIASCTINGKTIISKGLTREAAVESITPIVMYATRYFRAREAI